MMRPPLPAKLPCALLLALALAPSCGPSQPEPGTPKPVPSMATASAPTGPSAAPPATSTVPSASADLTPAPTISPPIAANAVADATGGKPEVAEAVVKVSFPRDDASVEVDGWKMPPFMGLTSWAAFSPARAPVEAMVMGDLVLFEDEVNPVMSVLLDAGVQVTALHNHFFFDKPHVYFMHLGGEGSIASLGKGVRLALEKAKEIRKKVPKPGESFGGSKLPAKSTLDASKVEAALGVKGMAKDGMFKATMGRDTSAACGCPVGKVMGVNTWAAFAGADDNAMVDGDFAVTEPELQPVLKSLRASGVNVVAIHHHMSGESPRILFLHYWGRGKAVDLAGAIKKALSLTAWDGKGKIEG